MLEKIKGIRSPWLLCWLLAAALLALAGLGCLLGGGELASIMTGWIGALLTLSGLLQLAANYGMRRTHFGDHAFFTRGVLTLVTGVLVLCQAFIAGEVIRVLVSAMVLLDGIGLAETGLAMGKARVGGRWWLVLAGGLEAALGVVGFLKPEILRITLSLLLGLSILAEALTLGLAGALALRWQRQNGGKP